MANKGGGAYILWGEKGKGGYLLMDILWVGKKAILATLDYLFICGVLDPRYYFNQWKARLR